MPVMKIQQSVMHGQCDARPVVTSSAEYQHCMVSSKLYWLVIKV